MGRRVSSQSQQDKLQRITRLQTAIASLETYKSFFEGQGELAPEDAWVARYQVRQPQKAYWYYKLQAPSPTFPTTGDTPKLSKYKHLGKAGSQAHVAGVMAVARRTIVSELQKNIDSLKNSLLDISFDSEQENI
ncbi:MAG: transposase [Moorea sp. SIO1F2]|uniref:transposase n=1 Tax=unclassified Moorena TaxID=2683338 RepID=UPI0013B8FD2D|nr:MULTISPECIES: transposase [unclassified Moorena]NEO19757.1 transposase [Moorena sp. SIO4A5]NEP27373.1 transposase [Moorena sp. SIO3I6]NEQ56650.1 transposase [Moorena sp. SIO4A1]NET81808.1 transposase [Moorena sp. SIO1F2]